MSPGAHLRPAALVLLAIAAAAAGGCGSSETTPEQEAAGTIVVFLDACAANDPVKAQETMSEPTRARFAGAATVLRGCEEISGLRPATLAGFRKAALEGVEVDGGFGTARVSSPFGDAEIELEQDAGAWRIAQPPREVEPA